MDELLNEKKIFLLNTGPGVKGEPHNLLVNPTWGSRGGERASWESFTDTGCRENCPLLVSWTVWLHAGETSSQGSDTRR